MREAECGGETATVRNSTGLRWAVRAAVFAVLGAAVWALVRFGPRADEPVRTAAPVPPPPERRVVRLQLVVRAEQPVLVLAPPGDHQRLFVVEKTGKVRIVRERRLLEQPFVDLSGRLAERHLEQGLLGMAFHPRYAENRRFFLNFTDREGDTRVIEMRASETDPDRADPASERLLLRVEQPFANHNGGHLCFGPDGYLYIGLGDGGWRGDPHNHGQDPETLLGAMLRIDVDRQSGTRPYAIPEDNPWADGRGGRPEVWAIGLRNPWRYSFDRKTGDLYIADVGQDRYEEVHVTAAGTGAGVNYGWNQFEGMHRYARLGRRYDIARLQMPVLEYGRRDGCSITGGFVYRGAELPELQGHYFYADYCTGIIRSFRWTDGQVQEHWDWTELLNPGRRIVGWSSFGEDAQGELYLVSLAGGIYRFARAGGSAPGEGERSRERAGDAAR
ncbi:MAG: hypothetical protein KatS3mg102_2773 [Planctomycetota bacterium]|nr:MAG: hypothetical protein KatS3mg102_2773 [Planctomycetota bacterium]